MRSCSGEAEKAYKDMNYIKSKKYDEPRINARIMGPNPLKLTEELLKDHRIPHNGIVMDLGSGQGVTSVFLAKEYGFTVFAADLWSDPTDNMRFFTEMGLTSKQIVPIHADATELPFAHDFFDGVVCTDSYNYFGRDKRYLGAKLLPFVKPGGYIYIVVPGMKQDMHDRLPEPLLASWTPEQLDYIHDAAYWKDILGETPGAERVDIRQMQGNEELWADWIICDNDYAKNDRAAIQAGACELLNFIAITIKRKAE